MNHPDASEEDAVVYFLSLAHNFINLTPDCPIIYSLPSFIESKRCLNKFIVLRGPRLPGHGPPPAAGAAARAGSGHEEGGRDAQGRKAAGASVRPQLALAGIVGQPRQARRGARRHRDERPQERRGVPHRPSRARHRAVQPAVREPSRDSGRGRSHPRARMGGSRRLRLPAQGRRRREGEDHQRHDGSSPAQRRAHGLPVHVAGRPAGVGFRGSLRRRPRAALQRQEGALARRGAQGVQGGRRRAHPHAGRGQDAARAIPRSGQGDARQRRAPVADRPVAVAQPARLHGQGRRRRHRLGPVDLHRRGARVRGPQPPRRRRSSATATS